MKSAIIATDLELLGFFEIIQTIPIIYIVKNNLAGVVYGKEVQNHR